MAQQRTIFLAGGGTGGHLYPGIAVAEAMAVRWPDFKPIFLCTQRAIDQMILEPTGFDSIAQPIVPPHRSVGGLLRFWRSWRETKDLIGRLLREHRPAAVLGLGGYAAGVAVKMASLAGVPTAILNPDVIPGKANQYLMRYSKLVCCQFDSTAKRVSADYRDRLVTTGCPIRADICNLPPRAAAAGRLAIDPNLRTLLITGASQGAQTINEAMVELMAGLSLTGWQILHLAGKEHAEGVRNGYQKNNAPAKVIDFTPAMADVWAATDLAVSRSGASSCAELTCCGIASILLPYPYHKDMHQRANAKVLAEAGAAVLLEDQKNAAKNAEKLKGAIEPLLYDGPRRQAMSAAAKALAKPQAAQTVADLVAGMESLRQDV